MRYMVDESWRRFGRVVLAGSPLRVFRLTAAGEALAARIERTADVAPSTLLDRLLDGGAVHPVPHQRARTYTMDDVTVVTPQLGGIPEDDGRIVVDDGSTPPVPGATLRLRHNVGPGAARNAGRALVTTPLVAFVDADLDTLDELGAGSWTHDLLAHFDDPRVGLVAPRVCGEPGSPLDLGPEAARIRAGTRVSYVPGAALVVRASAFDEVGGFDESMRYGEDVDLVWRLDEAGWRCRYEPASVVWHEPRETLGARLRQHAAYGSSAAHLASRHPHALAPWRSNGWTLASWLLAGLGRPVSGGALAVGSALALTRKLPDVPPHVAVRVAMTGHARAAQQLTDAVRRAWWPLVAVGAIASRRLRWLGLASIVASPATAATDLAYGWGLWRGMREAGTIAPIVPQVSAWPPRRSPPRPAVATRRGRSAAAR